MGYNLLQDTQSTVNPDASPSPSGRVPSQDFQTQAEQGTAPSRCWSHAPDQELEAAFGKLIRTVTAGESFGELALLQQNARRTASILTSPAGAEAGDADRHGRGTVSLLRIARKDYDVAVRPCVARVHNVPFAMLLTCALSCWHQCKGLTYKE